MSEKPFDEVLMQAGDFRLVRFGMGENSAIIQHHCSNKFDTGHTFCDPTNGWYYCWGGERKCAGCGAETPPEMVGLKTLYEWER